MEIVEYREKNFFTAIFKVSFLIFYFGEIAKLFSTCSIITDFGEVSRKKLDS